MYETLDRARVRGEEKWSNIACVLRDDPWAAALRAFDLTEPGAARAAEELLRKAAGAEGTQPLFLGAAGNRTAGNRTKRPARRKQDREDRGAREN